MGSIYFHRLLRSKVICTCSLFTSPFARIGDMRISWAQEDVKEHVPCTFEILSSKMHSLDALGVGYCARAPPDAVEKSVVSSYLELFLPFSRNTSLRESMVWPDGKTIRYGKLFELLDALAADIAIRHCGAVLQENGKFNKTVVTASVDGMRAFAAIGVSGDLSLQGYVTYVGRSSLEVCIDLLQHPLDSREQVVGRTHFIMVSRCPVKETALSVPRLQLHSSAELQRHSIGEQRAKRRKMRQIDSLAFKAPRSDEVQLIHQLYMDSVKLKEQKDAWLQSESKKDDKNKSSVSVTPFKRVKWMRHAVHRNVLMMHPQNRNVNGHIFGGYIMKRAFEVAWVAVICFAGTTDVRFRSVDDIQFVKPVSVGNVLEFEANVVYTNKCYAVVQVVAKAIDIASGVKTKTNIFNYAFSTECDMPEVMPREYQEIVLYLQGRRVMEELLATE